MKFRRAEPQVNATETARLDGLTIIRFLAALWVFVFHFDLRISLPAPTPLARIISNGALAMPVFFMLSGLVLGLRYQYSYTSFGAFFRARVARIYPAYFLGLIACLPWLFFSHQGDLATLLFLLPVDILLLQAWYPNLWHYWHHTGTWSISVEFFLYASFPLFLGLAKLTTRNLKLVGLACALFAGSFVPSLGLPTSRPLPVPVFYALPIFSLPAFVIGITLAELHRRGARGSVWAVLGLPVFLGIWGHLNTRYAQFNAITLPLIAGSLLYFARLAGGSGFERMSIYRALVYLGEISYAFFVFQIPLLLALEQLLPHLPALHWSATFFSLLVVNMAVAAISHHWLEPAGSALVKRWWRLPAAR